MTLLDDPVFRALDDVAAAGDQVAREILDHYSNGEYEVNDVGSSRDVAIIRYIERRAICARPVLVHDGAGVPVAVSTEPRPLTDPEMVALAALVDGDAAYYHAVNCIASDRGHGFAEFQSAAFARLEEEMRRRKIL